MAADFSRKHCRQRSSPYLRIRPAWWEQRRLKWCINQRGPHPNVPGVVEWTTATHHWRLPLPYFLGRENQTASWVILGCLWGYCSSSLGIRMVWKTRRKTDDFTLTRSCWGWELSWPPRGKIWRVGIVLHPWDFCTVIRQSYIKLSHVNSFKAAS